ncbi:MAG: porin [Prevotellaceae bacterium]|nr:porin [Prevotellaceae bacterium]
MKATLSLILSLLFLPLMAEEASTCSADSAPALGRTLSSYVSKPKFGGYFIGKYAYSDQKGQHGGEGFSQRFIRAYVDGTILTDFKYRIQVQVNNSAFHMKDYYVEWSHWKELAVKVGQYKRAFLLENPYNPWDVGAGDYSQIARHLSGIGDKDGNVANGGRDQGIQVQGDLFSSKRDGHPYLHYQLQMMNGQGINSTDANRRKDFLGTLQFQPVKGLHFGVFGWTGNYVAPDGTTQDRKRWAASVLYDDGGWVARAEYAHSKGYLRADGWYVTVGAPLTPWLQLYAKYDAYRPQKAWSSMKTIYSVIPNFQIHKNLMLQVQYNHVNDRSLSSPNYNEVWGEVYVRF